MLNEVRTLIDEIKKRWRGQSKLTLAVVVVCVYIVAVIVALTLLGD